MNKLSVVKIGGGVIEDTKKLSAFLKDFTLLSEPKILVHGGGKKASAVSKAMGISPKMIDGRRITDQTALEIVLMVYGGLTNKQIVAHLQAEGCNAIGLSGADGNTILAERRPVQTIDFGFVGDIKIVNTQAIHQLLTQGLTPVFCALTHDGQGQLLNTNADTIAAEIATAMSKQYQTNLLYCFEKQGVLLDVSDENSLLEALNYERYLELRKEGIIADGMLPKLSNAFQALERGVSEVRIGNEHMLQKTHNLYTRIHP